MINRLAVFGATGDLCARFLLPGLAALCARGHLDDSFELVCSDQDDWDTEQFRSWAAEQLDEHGDELPAEARRAVAGAARFVRADVTDPDEVAAVIAGEGPLAVYLALPPSLFSSALSTVERCGLPGGSRIVLEKPFGENLDSAVELNQMLAGMVPEDAVFRVDHFLAMATVENVLGARLVNRVLEPVWNSAHISEVEIVWDEDLALEGRAGYYDNAGALRDMVQNHLLQLLCLVAMEPPNSLSERDLRDRKVDVLRSVRPLSDDDVVRGTRRARYGAGRLNGSVVPAYVDEEGVDPKRETETYAEVQLELDSRRWAGTTFRLRTGKALGSNRKEVAVHFKPVPHLPFGSAGEVQPNVLRFGLEHETVSLDLMGAGAQVRSFAPLTLTAQMTEPDLPPYGRLLLDALSGNAALSIRGDEAEEAWRLLDPVLSAWERCLVPMQEYPAGGDGPPDTSAEHDESADAQR
ncbi:glucose-6-phosphate dehydrogenase [Saccharopolyspora rhizosphaerae]|uniref:Glucose-6-phosphate 1-dehydrogenase n=1 Tax=Saccharopolyspora rhizosphaerae TaxID=2492662 RepID=A0A3R8P3C2_9PSEU|nr:glucose-6-phosphate dehydrogenase [Saccharopolyspora rhizosphaerae]RRO18704.1 glucose-6-phosphate dehydrogenase [Saccharopolyspora rhizosphaerae]